MKLSMINWDLKTLIGRSTNFTSLINFVIAQDQGCLTIDKDLLKNNWKIDQFYGFE